MDKMALKQTLESATNRLSSRLPNFSAQRDKLAQAAKEIMTQHNAPPRQPQKTELAIIAGKMRNNQWNDITPSERRISPWALFIQLKKSIHTLADDEAFIARYFIWLEEHGQLPISHLAGTYLVHFNDSPAIAEIGRAISYALTKNPQKWKQWRHRHNKFRLFSSADAAANIAQEYMVSETEIKNILEEAGLSGGLYINSKLTINAFLYALNNKHLINKNQAWREWLDKILLWMDMLEIASIKKDIAHAFLSPWKTNDPADSTRQKLVQFFVRDKNFGDPRINKDSWFLIDDTNKRVLYRWLTKASIEQFFDIINKTCHGAGEHLWEARHKFWNDYYENGSLSEAWAAFSTQGLNYLRHHANEEDIQYAKLSGVGQSNHAVLFMRIGNLIIADWNLNGRCRIWKHNNIGKPALYEDIYIQDKLRNSNPDDKIYHSGDWQSKVRNSITKLNNEY